MTRRNRRRYDSHVSHERWLVSYADFITLLFAFFTTLYAISTVDRQKLSQMVESMQAAFDSTAARPAEAVRPPTPPPERAALEPNNLEELRQRLSLRLQRQIAGGQVGLEVDPRGLVVTIREAGTFAIGSADLSPAAIAVLSEVADALDGIEHPVRVEGHTDDVPIHTDRFRSNWELSTARATSVVAFFVQARGLPPARFSAAGYGEFHPRSANDSDAARAQNRRVDIVILNAATTKAEEPSARAATATPAEPRPAAIPEDAAPAQTSPPAQTPAPGPSASAAPSI